MSRKPNPPMRANPRFSALVRRLVREGTSAEKRTVTATEVTGLLAAIMPASWPELRAIVGASHAPTEESKS